MKSSTRAHGPYFSTSQTAQMLGLSVGTIQRMVESGALQAYTTQGGHRRILATSVQQFCQTQGVPGIHPGSGEAPDVCIVHDANMGASLQQALSHMSHVLLVSHPLELTGLPQECAAFFMDARVPWLDWPDLHRPLDMAQKARLIVYNSADLSAEQRPSVARHAQLHPGDISVDLVAGFLLGLHTDAPIQAQPASAHH